MIRVILIQESVTFDAETIVLLTSVFSFSFTLKGNRLLNYKQCKQLRCRYIVLLNSFSIILRDRCMAV